MFRPLKAIPIADIKTAVLRNSVTVAVGDALIPGPTAHAKFPLGAASSTTRILGVVISIMGANGTVTELNSVTTGSSNETTPVYLVQYIPSYLDIEYEADMSAAIGTTTDSDGVGVSFNLNATNNTLDETSVALGTATTKQFVSYGQSDVQAAPNTRIVGHWAKTLAL